MANNKRIKETVDSNGVSTFYPQYKFLWMWFYYENCGHITDFDTYEEAKEFIDYKPVTKTKIHEV